LSDRASADLLLLFLLPLTVHCFSLPIPPRRSIIPTSFSSFRKAATVGPTLSKLLDLQKQHIILRGLQKKAHANDAAVAVKEKLVARLKADLDKILDARKVLQRAGDVKELEVKSLQAKIAKFREQLNAIKTNKEYQALQNEIKFAEIEQRRHEDLILKDMEKAETDAHKVDEAKAALAQAEKESAELKAKRAAEIEALQADIRKAERDRADAAREVPRDALDRFERVAAKSDDGAMCALIRDEDAHVEDAYCCGCCNIGLTENIYVKLLGNTDDLIVCPNCSHILFLQP
jgi:hypothetical protein